MEKVREGFSARVNGKKGRGAPFSDRIVLDSQTHDTSGQFKNRKYFQKIRQTYMRYGC